MATNINVIRFVEKDLKAGDFVRCNYDSDPNGRPSPPQSYMDMPEHIRNGDSVDKSWYTGQVVFIKVSKAGHPFFGILPIERNFEIRTLSPCKGTLYSIEYLNTQGDFEDKAGYGGLWDSGAYPYL